MEQNNIDDLRLNYLVHSFKNISHKPFESYVIHRIWHRLGDDRVQFILQQYVNRGDRGKYALADLYLPQVKMVVEVNEKYHYTTEEPKGRFNPQCGNIQTRHVGCASRQLRPVT